MLTLNIFTSCSSVSIVNYEQVNAGWDTNYSIQTYLMDSEDVIIAKSCDFG